VRLSELKKIIVRPETKYMAELKNGGLIPIGGTKYKEIKAKWL
jgi:two-component system response regulator LytT